jgi:hypothetical protein
MVKYIQCIQNNVFNTLKSSVQVNLGKIDHEKNMVLFIQFLYVNSTI